jgi:AbrB family looped-hinge helix DNA binding protein
MKFKTKVGERGQVVIPKAIRDSLGLDKNSAIEFEMKGTKVTLTPERDMRNLELAMKRYAGSMRKQLLAEGYRSTGEYMKAIRGR